jgi:leader peptidase (prepilin peptidase)/N-methyltransferase
VLGATALGLAAGALLPVPAYRLSVAMREPPRGDCAQCAASLPAGVPGWVRPTGRCAACGAPLGPHPALLAAVAGAACAGLAWRFGPSPALPPYLLVALLGVLLAAVDLACRRLPDALVLPGLAASVLMFTGVAAVSGEWGRLVRALGGGAALFVGYFVMSLLPGGPLGGGDVTLAALLGLCLGWLGWPLVTIGALLPFVVNAPVAVAVLIRRGRRARLPFGPAMLVGAYLAVVGLPAVGAFLAR